MFSFLRENWLEVGTTAFSLIAGISTYFSRKKNEAEEEKRTKAEFQLSIDKSHKGIWNTFHENADLQRVMADTANLESNPVTASEESFILLLLGHITSTVKAIDLGQYDEPQGMTEDIHNFFSKPVPNAIARKHLRFQSERVQKLISPVLTKPVDK